MSITCSARAATGEDKGYYAEYLGDTEKLGRALAEGFAFQGEMMEYRGEPRGEPSASLPPTAFIAFIQNHDQVGNRAFGERITAIANPRPCAPSPRCTCCCRRCRCCSWAKNGRASQPFPFFCDFGGELADAVRKGRRKEFAKFPEFKDEKVGSASPTRRPRIPSPRPSCAGTRRPLSRMRGWLEWYRRLLAMRRAEIVPRLAGIGGNAARFELIGEEAVLVRWRLGGGEELALAANLSATPREGFPAASGRILWQQAHRGRPLRSVGRALVH